MPARLTLREAWAQGASAVTRHEGALRRGLLLFWARLRGRLAQRPDEPETLPWAELEAPALAGWQAAVLPVLKDEPEPRPFGGLSLTDTERRALVWLEAQGLNLVRDLRQAEIQRIRQVLHRALVEGWDVPRMKRTILDSVGLDPRRARAVERFRERLADREDLTTAGTNARVERYADSLRRQRAEMIARTETVRARNQGNLSAWSQMQAEGELPRAARKRWVAAMGSPVTCAYCKALHRAKPIPLDQPFDAGLMAPPAHPNCRCSLVVV